MLGGPVGGDSRDSEIAARNGDFAVHDHEVKIRDSELTVQAGKLAGHEGAFKVGYRNVGDFELNVGRQVRGLQGRGPGCGAGCRAVRGSRHLHTLGWRYGCVGGASADHSFTRGGTCSLTNASKTSADALAANDLKQMLSSASA